MVAMEIYGNRKVLKKLETFQGSQTVKRCTRTKSNPKRPLKFNLSIELTVFFPSFDPISNVEPGERHAGIVVQVLERTIIAALHHIGWVSENGVIFSPHLWPVIFKSDFLKTF